MIEKTVPELTLDHEEGRKFVQIGNNIVATGSDILYPKNLLSTQEPPMEKRTSRLVEPNPNQHLGPAGFADEEE